MKKIAIVHEMLVKLGGAEKVVENWMALYPEADVFTLIYDESQCGKIFPKEKIHPQVFSLRTQKIYSLTKKQRLCLPFMAQSIERLDLSAYDVILVSSSGFAHGVITKPETKTIVYYHAPARYMWDWTNEYKRDIKAQIGVKGYILNRLFLKLRQWDYIASRRHDISLANSATTAKRLKKYFRLESEILYPPIETARFAKKIEQQERKNILEKISKGLTQSPSLIAGVSRDDFFNILFSQNYYITLSALTEFKRIDIAIGAFKNTPDIPLVIIGDGEYRKHLEALADGAKNIFFVGKKFGNELVTLVQNSLGLIFPGEEDFGIVPIEIMAAGKPVFALKKGGLTETVIAGKTGDFFEDGAGKDFAEHFSIFHQKNITHEYTPKNCKKQAARFDKALFEERIEELVKN